MLIVGGEKAEVPYFSKLEILSSQDRSQDRELSLTEFILILLNLFNDGEIDFIVISLHVRKIMFLKLNNLHKNSQLICLGSRDQDQLINLKSQR